MSGYLLCHLTWINKKKIDHFGNDSKKTLTLLDIDHFCFTSYTQILSNNLGMSHFVTEMIEKVLK